MERIDIGQNVNLFRFRDTLDARIRRMFRVNGITTVRDLCLQNKRDLLKTREVGIRSIRLIETILESYGLWLGMHETELDEYARAAPKERKVPTAASAPEETEAAKWEQRRYEIAKEMFVQHRMLAVAAVKEADDLIAALGYMPHA